MIYKNRQRYLRIRSDILDVHRCIVCQSVNFNRSISTGRRQLVNVNWSMSAGTSSRKPRLCGAASRRAAGCAPPPKPPPPPPPPPLLNANATVSVGNLRISEPAEISVPNLRTGRRRGPPRRGGGRRSRGRHIGRAAALGHALAVTRSRSRELGHALSVTRSRSRALGHALSVTRTRSRALGHALSVTRSRSRALGHVHSAMRSRSRALGHALSVSVRARRRVCAAGNRLGSARLLRDDSES